MSTGTTYTFNNQEERYEICGKILDSVKNTKYIRKMSHIKRYDIVYSIYDTKDSLVCNGNASKNWKLMKDQINQQKIGKVKVLCVDVPKY